MPAKMSIVKDCAVQECAYNAENACHALAITIGEGGDPICHTFVCSTLHGGVDGGSAGVGACKVSGCRHNAGLECMAGGIRVGMEKIHPERRHADCMTYDPR
jgi:hypothetical protein